MKKHFKIVSLISIAAIGISIFAGCNSASPASSQATTAPTSAPKAIVMGTNPEFPPFEFVTEEGKGVVGKFDGVDLAISNEIAKALGQTLSVESMNFDGLIPALQTGKVDFVAAGMTITDERKQNVDFSDTYFVTIQSIVCKDSSTIKSAADLVGKKVGVVTGYTGDLAVGDMVKAGKNITVVQMNTGTDLIQELVNGKIDAVVIDSAPAKAFVQKNPGLKTVQDDKAFVGEEYGIAVKKGNTDLLNKINAVIKDMKASGKIDELITSYLK